MKEDEQNTEYRDAMDELDRLGKINVTNLAVVKLKQKNYPKCVEYCDEALKIDHKHPKALFIKARAYTEQMEYKQAIETFEDLMLHHPDHQEGKTELNKVKIMLKKYEDKSNAMAKKMFEQS